MIQAGVGFLQNPSLETSSRNRDAGSFRVIDTSIYFRTEDCDSDQVGFYVVTKDGIKITN